jgi:hypothetical protein
MAHNATYAKGEKFPAGKSLAAPRPGGCIPVASIARPSLYAAFFAATAAAGCYIYLQRECRQVLPHAAVCTTLRERRTSLFPVSQARGRGNQFRTWKQREKGQPGKGRAGSGAARAACEKLWGAPWGAPRGAPCFSSGQAPPNTRAPSRGVAE